MRILIAGAGKIGIALTRDLSAENHDIVVIDKNSEVLENEIGQYDVMSVEGNCAIMSTLEEANASISDLLIACTGSDEINLLCCMAARKINPNIHTIVRIRNSDYFHLVNEMKENFGISMDINPNRSAAREIFNVMQLPGYLKRETFAKNRVDIVEYKVPKGGILEDVPMFKLPVVLGLKVLLCTIVRDGKAFIPKGNDTILAGDHIYLTAPNSILVRLTEKLGLRTRKLKNVIIVGGGKLAALLTKQLMDHGVHVKIIERDRDTALLLADMFPNADIVVGDGSSHDLLESEGLATADAFVSLTGFDEMNVIMSMFASATGVPQISTKVNRMTTTTFLENLDIGAVINPEVLSCNAVVRYVRAMQNQTGAAHALHRIARGQAEILEFTVTEETKYIGRRLRDMKIKNNALIACIIHNGRVIIPDGDTEYHTDDSVLVVATGDRPIMSLNDIFA